MGLTSNHRAIIVAPNGAFKTKTDHPNLPMTESEMVSEVIACRDAGAAMVHLHARDKDGHHSLDIETNRRLYNKVKQAVGDTLLVQLTTEAVGRYTPEQQMDLIRAIQPEAASFALRELVADESCYQVAKDFFAWTVEQAIVSQIILYDQSDIDRFFLLRSLGVLPCQNQHALVVLGRYKNRHQASPWDLKRLNIDAFEQHNVRVAICAFGSKEQDCLLSALLLGLDVRVGFENNHMTPMEIPARTNADQVRNLIKINKLFNVFHDDAYSFRRALNATDSGPPSKTDGDQ
ncbi:3-keto-5-aminohexanoate cleavage protein [Vibrio ostreicida]|uniref:3-keto-5-aminohexanoate cleavage protein n=1 Tax=Vibrio ostreicida TaxID=526588 RepID=A0ABT8C175_9VIBR|nr:3-keto-5-aminohexanoate cleavage protein [Vibrio ostreicida]MDN3612098.1 3-keto-5-aminohexanoate cleavage protein [Vibrio ostreicida]NPD08733.1 3-keto-5-aminohexanoate cleavage protein [Vibrio ostreicida]